jgi:hypothetical protein
MTTTEPLSPKSLARLRAAMDDPRPRISQPVTSYPYPRTIPELIQYRRAQLEARGPEDPPVCHYSEHGLLVLRPLEGQSYESLYCGLWWDCQRCASSTLYPSRDLCYDHGEPYDTGRGWEKHTPGGWAPVSDDERHTFWSALKAWDEARQPKPRAPRRQSAAHRHARGPAA